MPYRRPIIAKEAIWPGQSTSGPAAGNGCLKGLLAQRPAAACRASASLGEVHLSNAADIACVPLVRRLLAGWTDRRASPRLNQSLEERPARLLDLVDRRAELHALPAKMRKRRATSLRSFRGKPRRPSEQPISSMRRSTRPGENVQSRDTGTQTAKGSNHELRKGGAGTREWGEKDKETGHGEEKESTQETGGRREERRDPIDERGHGTKRRAEREEGGESREEVGERKRERREERGRE
jgi:hypothetical protein